MAAESVKSPNLTHPPANKDVEQAKQAPAPARPRPPPARTNHARTGRSHRGEQGQEQFTLAPLDSRRHSAARRRNLLRHHRQLEFLDREPRDTGDR